MGICGAHGCHRNLDRRVARAGGRGPSPPHGLSCPPLGHNSRRLAFADFVATSGRRAAFLLPKSGAVMKRHQALSVAVALAPWAGAARAMPPESESAPGLPASAADRRRCIRVEARTPAGVSGWAAVLFGVAHERGRYRR